MRQTKRPPIPPTARERDAVARTYSHMVDGTAVSLTAKALRELTVQKRDTQAEQRRERRRMAVICRDDNRQARLNKAIQRYFDKVERRFPPKKTSVRVEPENRRQFKRGERRVTPTELVVSLPAYDGAILDRQGRRGIVMTIGYDGAQKHSFGIVGRRIAYDLNPASCELDANGKPVVQSNMGEDIHEIMMAADLIEAAQRETRANAKLGVNIVVQFPHDVPQEVRAAILKAVCHELFGRHGLPYAASLHRPDRKSDQRNFHAHIWASWRPMTRTAPYSWDVADDFRSDLDGAAYWRHARRRVAEIMTATLARAGTDRHYTHLSNAERGLAHKPQKKLDKRKTRESREGKFVADNEANRRIIEANIAHEEKMAKKREERRTKALKRKLAAIARIDLVRHKPVDLRAVSDAVMAPERPRIERVLGPQRQAFTKVKAVATAIFRNHLQQVTPPARRPLTIKPDAVAAATEHKLGAGGLRKVTARTPTDLLKKIKPIMSAAERFQPSLRPVARPVRPAKSISVGPVQSVEEAGRPVLRAVNPVEPAKPVASIFESVPTVQGSAFNLRPFATTVSWSRLTRVEPVRNPADTDGRIAKITALQSIDKSCRIEPVRMPPAPQQTALRPVTEPMKVSAEAQAKLTKVSIEPPPPISAVLHRVKPWTSKTSAGHLAPVAAPRTPPVVDLQAASGPPPVKREFKLKPVSGYKPPPRAFLKAVSTEHPRKAPLSSVIRPVETQVGLVKRLSPVAPPRKPILDPALMAAMKSLEQRLAEIAELAAARRKKQAPTTAPSTPQTGRPTPEYAEGASALTSKADDIAREVEAARAYAARIKNDTVFVARHRDILFPDPKIWFVNRLTERGLRDLQVQKEFARMEQRQVDFVKRVGPKIVETCTAQTLAEGRDAVIEKLPEEERAEARSWSETVLWKSLMKRIAEEGAQRSEKRLTEWRAAREESNAARFLAAAQAKAQLAKWPVALSQEQQTQLDDDAKKHRARLARQQAAAMQRGSY